MKAHIGQKRTYPQRRGKKDKLRGTRYRAKKYANANQLSGIEKAKIEAYQQGSSRAYPTSVRFLQALHQVCLLVTNIG